MRIVTMRASVDESKCLRTKEGVSPCEAACPIHQDNRGIVTLVSKGLYEDALDVILRDNPIPSICGRVCVHPCEDACMRGEKLDEPLGIQYLKRFVCDYVGDYALPKPETLTKEKVAVVGSGPAGIACAYDLRRMGYQVTIFEALGVAGGMLAVGIPDYRLPKSVLRSEMKRLQDIGVEFKLNTPIGKKVTLKDLRKQYDAVFLALGAHVERKMEVPGEDLKGVFAGIEFLRRVNLGEKSEVGEKVAVVGGGNSAVDVARTVKRLGAKDVKIVYRRSREEMPANPDEVGEAEREGVKIEFLTLPTKVLGDKKVKEIECIRMKLGEPDESGRKRPIPIKGSEFKMPCDTLIVTIGQAPDVESLGDRLGIETSKWGTFSVDPVTLQTNVEGVFAGGDCVTGPETVVGSMFHGRKAATSIHRFLNKMDMREGREFEGAYESKVEVDVEGIPVRKRAEMPKLEVSRRKAFEEVDLGLTEELARSEAERCLGCACRICELVCPTLAIKITGRLHEVDEDVCNGCGNCESRCPVKAINMEKVPERVVYTDPSTVDREKIEELCRKAKFHPEQILCFCTATRAEEVAAAILKGAKGPVDLTRMTGIRSGCKVECIQPQLRLLEAAGIKVEPAPGWQWYGRTPTIWEIPENVRQKHSKRGFYFEEDIKLMEKVAKAPSRRR